ncbi:MAG: outer membrane lipoprotein-sorting protein [Pyrinomonadaceae bacterium]
MFLKSFICALVIACSSLTVAAQELTVDQIIAKNIAAKGGMEKIKAQKSLRMSGRMTLGPGLEAPVIMEQKRPGSFRLELTLQGLTAVQAYDGQTGWQIMPFQGKKDPETMGEDDLKEAQEQADIDGPLVDYKEKGNKVELVGHEQVEGSDAYKLKVTLKNGEVRYLYLDADSFLEIKEESKRTIRGTEREGETIFGDYKEEGGVMMAHSIEAGAKGSAEKQKVTIEKVEINPVLDDARFKLPATAAPAGNKPTAKPENPPAETKPADKKPPETKPPTKPPVNS